MPFALKARFIVPVAGEPISGGVVVVDQGRIVGVERDAPGGIDVIDLDAHNKVTGGGVVLLPGFVNAHTHLEFSELNVPLGRRGISFPDWIRALIAHRLEIDSPPAPETIRRGLLECLRSGTTAVGEIAPNRWPWGALDEERVVAADHPHLTLFREFLGLPAERVEQTEAELRELEAHFAAGRTNASLAVSPHAPYSTHWEMAEEICMYARRHDVPLAMHLAESREELELLQSHTGPFRTLLADLGVWNPRGIPLGSRPLDYLRLLATSPCSLVVHANYLNDEEIDFIAQQRQRMSVVFCPRTHDYFEHDPHPLLKLIERGAQVVLGTDSRASNPDLSLLEEMRQVAKVFPSLASDAVVRMGTLASAGALRRQGESGSIEVGKRADFAVVALDETVRNPYESVVQSGHPNVATYIGGKCVYNCRNDHHTDPSKAIGEERI